MYEEASSSRGWIRRRVSLVKATGRTDAGGEWVELTGSWLLGLVESEKKIVGT